MEYGADALELVCDLAGLFRVRVADDLKVRASHLEPDVRLFPGGGGCPGG